ncbi:hypothetical protein GCM10008014_20840 [Paenibacillus silvae]|uniref:Uncharacterized protein n=1 Tax=Paenibacillus silvae TaxID=1325358 RepID=A0ABQ1ZAC7_9BACL|nr:hypothetical protein GCM10008014_20840 [Paenibacillus silvae]
MQIKQRISKDSPRHAEKEASFPGKLASFRTIRTMHLSGVYKWIHVDHVRISYQVQV